jgi:hypothetical protein
MMGSLILEATLTVSAYSPDGDLLDVSCDSMARTPSRRLLYRMWQEMKRAKIIPLWVGFAAFLSWATGDASAMALVTTVGVDFMMKDFADQGQDVSTFKYMGTGTGSTAASAADTDLVAPLALARVTAAQGSPAVRQFQVNGAFTYAATATITEWGLFSSAGSGLPPTGGTLWDRRILNPVRDVVNGTVLGFSYTCTANGGGS